MKKTPLFAFTLGRENKLSLAELISLFGSDALIDFDDLIAIFSLEIDEDILIAKFRNIGGSIRMMRLIGETDEKRFPTDVITTIGKPEGKYTFALGSYGVEYRLSDIGLRIKKTLGESGISARLSNTENKNIVSAVWKRDKLGRSQSEYNLVHIKGMHHLGVTLACQDIDAYTRRDLGKSRDMVVGMMPPKLVQVMVNIGSSGNYSGTLYDPFCGLGTTLIEGANMGYTGLSGSDISDEMVHATEKSMKNYIADEKLWQDRIRTAGGKPHRDVEAIRWEVWQMDASKIGHTKREFDGVMMVSEGYLGEIMQKTSMSLERVQEERKKLTFMYEGFFGGLERIDFSGVIVMTFPFWDIHGTPSFFSEIYDVIGRHGFDVIPLLPVDSMRALMTPKGSLLYKRPGQNVGREVIKIRKR